MQIYSFNENNNELLIKTLRDADRIDACTFSVPLNSVVANSELPSLSNNQAYIVMGTRNQDGYFTVTKNVSAIDDYRGKKVYLKTTGEEIEHKELGALPDTVTLIAPVPYSEWSESANNWVEKPNANELRMQDRRKNAGSLNRNQILTELEIRLGFNKEKLVDIANERLEGVRQIKIRNIILEGQSFNLDNDDLWQFFTETLNIEPERLFEFWEEAKNNY